MIGHPNGERGYRVHFSAVIAAELKRLQRRAKQEGRGKELLAALAQLYQQLRQDPNGVGEPLYRLPSLRLIVRTVIVRPLTVDFAVCEDRPLVFIKGVQLLAV
jgi:hypothetical protein